MADVHTKKQRSYNMSRIKGSNTKPELLIRRALFAKGFRYCLHRKDLPGKPDLTFPKYKAVVFINGCFWHYHECELFKMPGTRRKWWKDKLTRTRARDTDHITNLLDAGWRVLTVWECAFRGKGKTQKDFDRIISSTEKWLRSGIRQKQLQS